MKLTAPSYFTEIRLVLSGTKHRDRPDISCLSSTKCTVALYTRRLANSELKKFHIHSFDFGLFLFKTILA
jgi:hypothetical protein